MRLLYHIVQNIRRVWHHFVIIPVIKSAFEHCGKNVYIGPKCNLTCRNISIGNSSVLGTNTRIMSTDARTIIGDNVMSGPGVTIITGDHRTDLIGRTMRSVGKDEKLPENDMDVVIQNDVWIGANATILKGVTIGEGAIIGACSLVTKDVAPYSICAGIPAHEIKKRFSDEDIEKHRMMIQENEGL